MISCEHTQSSAYGEGLGLDDRDMDNTCTVTHTPTPDPTRFLSRHSISNMQACKNQYGKKSASSYRNIYRSNIIILGQTFIRLNQSLYRSTAQYLQHAISVLPAKQR